MKSQRMSVKRRPARKGGVRTLFANVARKKKSHRAATTATPADYEDDVPDLGIARALVVILIIHVVAIAGIFIHSNWLDDEAPVASTDKTPVKAVGALAPANAGEADLPKIRTGDSLYTVGTGDTYEGIAGRFGIGEEDLRNANDNIPLRQGRYLRIPPKTITAVEPPEVAVLRSGGMPVRVEPAVSRQEVIAVDDGMIDTEAARQADARQSGESAANTATPAVSSVRYKVKSGDTFWAIAKKHGTTVDKLMTANKITNARRLKVGMNLVIPK